MTSLIQAAPFRPSRVEGVWAPAGVPVVVGPSWALGLALTAWTVADAVLPEAVPGRSPVAYAATGLAAAAALALGIVLHEAAHCAAARRAGLGVRRITLTFLGGSLELADPPATPGAEARVALAGPLASGLAALAAGIVHVVLEVADADPLASAAAAVVALANLLVAALNALPASPLDGGRAARAALWALTGREATGAPAVAVAGRILSGALLTLAVLASASGDGAIAIWLGLLGLSLR
jgi:Zn-dependent protease